MEIVPILKVKRFLRRTITIEQIIDDKMSNVKYRLVVGKKIIKTFDYLWDAVLFINKLFPN